MPPPGFTWVDRPRLAALSRPQSGDDLQWLRRNGGYSYRSYGEVFRRCLLSRKDPVAHPIWTPAEAGRPQR